MAEPQESIQDGFPDQFAAEGNYAMAIAIARTVLREYEGKAASDPDYQPLVERTRAKIARFTAEADAAGAPTELQPDAFTLALIASAEPDPSPADEAVIARAKAEAAAEGTGGYVTQMLAGMAALREPDSVSYAGFDAADVRAVSAEFQRTIERKYRSMRFEASVSQAVFTTAAMPAWPARNLARRFARQSALLRRFGRHRDAVSAVNLAANHFGQRTELDDDEKGYFAYCLVDLAEDFLKRRDFEGAFQAAARANGLFEEFYQRLIPTCVPDVVRNVLVLAESQARLGHVAPAREWLAQTVWLADALDRSFGAPFGSPGSMPGGWGLPIVPSAKEWKALRARLARLPRQW